MNSELLNCEEYINKSKNKAGVISIITRDYYTPIKDLVDIFDVTNTKCRKFIINSNEKFCKFVETCYSLSCEPEPDSWTNKIGKKKPFLKWMKDNNVREIAKIILYRVKRNAISLNLILINLITK